MATAQTRYDVSPEFDRYAPSYLQLLDDPVKDRFSHDRLHFHRRKWVLIQRLLDRAGMRPANLRWLDVGCGQGELLNLAGPHFREAYGCDPSPQMLASCNSYSVKKQWPSTELPFEDGSMDFVTSVCVYHHVHGKDREILTQEIRRVLSPNGLCCIIEHNPWNPVTQLIVSRCAVDADADLLSAAQTRRILKAAGFYTFPPTYFLYLPEMLADRFPHTEDLVERLPFGGQYALMGRNQQQCRCRRG